MRVRGISTLEEANVFFNSYYIGKHNNRRRKRTRESGFPLKTILEGAPTACFSNE